METSAGVARAPFEALITVRACQCRTPATSVGRGRTLDRAIGKIEGYWNVYMGFFGDQIVWMNFDVVDVRTGRVVWRNGRHTTTQGADSDLIA